MAPPPLALHRLPAYGESQIISAPSLSLELTQPVRSYYRHGWQSWSLTAWTNPDREIPVMKPTSFHNRQTDPVYARFPHPNGSWLGAVELAEDDILLLGALQLEAHVALRPGQFQGWYESGNGDWFLARGKELDIFERYAQLLAERLGKIERQKPPRVWCSWYSLYDNISEKNLLEVLAGLANLPFDVFQVDDGWQIGTGDWEANSKFPSGMASFAAKVRGTGRKAGLWLAPLTVGRSSSLCQEHADWLLRDADGKLIIAGFEWSEETYALDTTHPEVIEWLQDLIQRVRGWGFDYLKLDFLSAGALPGKRYRAVPRETAFRQALAAIRQAAEDAYLLLCGTPILPALGLCDAIRIGADVGNHWDSHLYDYLLYNQTTPGVRNAIRTSVNRLWLSPLVNLDPDVAYFSETKSLTEAQEVLLRDLTEICGTKATSDIPNTWTHRQRSTVQQWLESDPKVARSGRYMFTVNGRAVDFSRVVPLPREPRLFDALLSQILGWLGNQTWALRLWHRLFRYRHAQ